MKLKQFAGKAIDLGSRLRLDDMELLLNASTELSARIERCDITLELDRDVFTAGVRVLKKGRLGYVPITEPDLDVLRTGINAALANAGPAPFRRFSEMSDRSQQLKTYDAKVASLADSPTRMRDICRDIIAAAYATKKVQNLEGGVSANVSERLVTTMHGSHMAHARRTYFSAFAEVDSKDFDFAATRKLPDLSKVAGIGAGVARSIPRQEATPEHEGIKGRTVPVILHPMLVESMVRRLVCEHIYASTAQDGMSRYAIGDRVGSELVTLWDDGTAPWSGATFPTDDEGTPTRRTTLVADGVLQTWLYDRSSALKDGTEPTGNGYRRSVLIENEHEAPVRCGASDLFLKPGRTPLSTMVKSIKRGLLVKYLLGFHTANRTTSDFANTLYVGRVIRNGRIAAMPTPGRWSLKGNALELLKNVSAVSRETAETGSGSMPWIQVELVVA